MFIFKISYISFLRLANLVFSVAGEAEAAGLEVFLSFLHCELHIWYIILRALPRSFHIGIIYIIFVSPSCSLALERRVLLSVFIISYVKIYYVYHNF